MKSKVGLTALILQMILLSILRKYTRLHVIIKIKLLLCITSVLYKSTPVLSAADIENTTNKCKTLHRNSYDLHDIADAFNDLLP